MDECLLGQRFLRVNTRTLFLVCFIGGVRDKSLLAQRMEGGGGGGEGRSSHGPNCKLTLLCFTFDYTPTHPHFSFYFLFIYLFIYFSSREKRPKQFFIGIISVFFFVSRLFTACSEFAFDFSTPLGIFWTICGVLDSPLLGKV